MVPDPITIIKTTLFVYGLYWMGVIAKRLPDDVCELRAATDAAKRWAILTHWAFTLLILAACVSFARGILGAAFAD